MKQALLDELRRSKDCVLMARAEQRLAAQALHVGERDRAQQHLATAVASSSSALEHLDALAALIHQKGETP